VPFLSFLPPKEQFKPDLPDLAIQYYIGGNKKSIKFYGRQQDWISLWPVGPSPAPLGVTPQRTARREPVYMFKKIKRRGLKPPFERKRISLSSF